MTRLQKITAKIGLQIEDKEVTEFLNLAINSYVVVQWPESQELMEEDWFEEEAILDTEGRFGSSAYFIPLDRLL